MTSWNFKHVILQLESFLLIWKSLNFEINQRVVESNCDLIIYRKL